MFIFIGQSVGKKLYLEEFVGKSLLKFCRQNWSQKKFGYSKVTVVILNPHLGWLLTVSFRRIKCNEE